MSSHEFAVRIHDLPAASHGFESQKSEWWWQEEHPELLSSNKVSLLTKSKLHDSAQQLIIRMVGMDTVIIQTGQT